MGMKTISLCWKDGKTGALTTSWDDGGIADRQLVTILNKHGLKGTWNLCSGRLGMDQGHSGWDNYIGSEEVKQLYSSHEVACHSVTHPSLVWMPDSVIFSEVIEDRRRLETLTGYPVKGMALPFGTSDLRVTAVLRQCGILYARTVGSKPDFELPVDFLGWQPTCHHKEDLERNWEKFTDIKFEVPKLFYLWGHSWEFDGDHNWDLIEKFSAIAGEDGDIWHATNYQVYEYVTAWRNLITTVEKTVIMNPSGVKLWFRVNDEVKSIEPGQVVQLGV
jgi:peptidoglycan-N-acetylglucosamine deacetylase